MTTNYPQVPWTDEQWALVTQTVQKEASRARVAATFLPLFGPLPPDTDFVRADKLKYKESPGTNSSEPERMWVDDKSNLAPGYVAREGVAARGPNGGSQLD